MIAIGKPEVREVCAELRLATCCTGGWGSHCTVMGEAEIKCLMCVEMYN